jgi:hypothetical protein
MKKESDITHLFRSRLSDVEMEPRADFWNTLQSDLPGSAAPHSSRLYLWRATAAVALVLLVSGTLVTYWQLAPRTEAPQVVTQRVKPVPILSQPEAETTAETAETIMGAAEQPTPSPAVAQATPAPVKASQSATRPRPSTGATLASHGSAADRSAANPADDDETVTVSVSVTITQRTTGRGNGRQTATTAAMSQDAEAVNDHEYAAPKPHNWALKVGVGTSLPTDNYNMPFRIEALAGYQIDRHLSAEAGLQFNYFPVSHGKDQRSLAIPVQLNVALMQTDKVDLYALAGGQAEIPGESASKDGSSKSPSPVVWSVKAGVGVRYKLNNNCALFAEATVSHHFSNDAVNLYTHTPSINANLLCGVRMTF